MVENSKLIDAPPHKLSFEDIAPQVKDYDLVVMHTSTPSFNSDIRTARLLRDLKPSLKIGLIGAKVAVEPEQSLNACEALDFVAREEFDFTIKEVAEGRDFAHVDGITYRNRDGHHRGQQGSPRPREHGRTAVRHARSTSATSTSTTISAAISSTPTSRSIRAAAANPAAPSAFGRRRSAATITAPARSAT